MKKQIIIIASVFLVAIILFVAYMFIKPQSDIVEVSEDDQYALTDEVTEALATIDGSYTVKFAGRQNAITTSTTKNRIYQFALSIAGSNNKITVVTDDTASTDDVTIVGGSGSKSVKYADFYKYLADETPYAHDAIGIIVGTILELDGKEAIEIELTALDGYDTDGDTVIASTGKPFVFPQKSRSDIQTLTITNQYGSYKILRKTSGSTSSLIFVGAEYVGYDKEKFSQLVVNATYVLASGKVKNHLGFEEYGLDSEANATASFTLVTTSGEAHKVIIGKSDPTGSYYYARYVGKDIVYMLPATDLEESLLLPESYYLTALLVYPITETEDVYNIDNVTISWPKNDITLVASQFKLCSLSDNAAAYQIDGSATAVTDLLKDKKTFSGTYTTWTDGSLFAGVKSSDKKEFYIDICLVNYAVDGNYKVEFGMLRDESTGAYLPEASRIAYSTDIGKTFVETDINMTYDQSNKEYKKYSYEFKSDDAVQYVRVYFTMPAGKYAVMDELRVYVDGADSQPADALVGSWRAVEPLDYVPEGKNFVYPDSTNFQTTLLTSLGSLVGDAVVETGICDNVYDIGTISKAKLAKYGLDEPDMIASFEFDGFVSTVYIAYPKDGGDYYYAYSTESSLSQDITICTDIIAEISLDTAAWLNWDIVDMLDHNLLSMYIDDIETLTITFGGKDYVFELIKDSNGKLTTVRIDGKTVDTQNFRYLYISIIGMSLKGEYEEGEEAPAEVLRIKIKSQSKNPEIVFYRVTTSKAYYTIDGQGRYYVLLDKVNTVKKNVGLLLAGQDVPR